MPPDALVQALARGEGGGDLVRLAREQAGGDHGVGRGAAEAVSGDPQQQRAQEVGQDDGGPGGGAVAQEVVAHGGDPVGFRARDLTSDLIAESDLVLTATRAHRGTVASMYPKALRRVFTFRDFADLVAGVDGVSARVTDRDPRVWIQQVTEHAAASRGLSPPLEPAQADIVDPFRREDKVFTTMAQQIVGSMPAVVRALAG